MKKIEKTKEEWKAQLTDEQFRILRENGTERAFTSEYNKFKGDGMFLCAGCGLALFDTDTKFDSGTGWPSYFKPADKDYVAEIEDTSHGMRRVEVRCARCDGHLGHVFPDGPKPTGLRYCINGDALSFADREKIEQLEANEDTPATQPSE